MEPIIHNTSLYPVPETDQQQESTLSVASNPFIEANTLSVDLEEIRDEHIIPVYAKDNEPLISHFDFLETVHRQVLEVYRGETILHPSVRVSHPIKGRIPDARNKPASQLEEWEKTLYYERMAFVIEIPSIREDVGGNALSLTIGGVKAYNMDRLHLKKGADEHFKVFVGFQNRVCTNLCVWTDGYLQDLRVSNLQQLAAAVGTLLQTYDQKRHLAELATFPGLHLEERQFAQLLGRARLYPYLQGELRRTLTPLLLTDTQMGTVARDYYKDPNFCGSGNGQINLWRAYNLLTGVNKSSYVDSFLDRALNAFQFIQQVRLTLEGKANSWFLQ
ncbi:DUF3871 family protein [Flaviaesturariibacter aridisoli]|uniref:DUF3871 family protein n=1 Tax=Flaviaesturariibacter aridisoli TaxID=2545761 RepID=A0A4R4E1J0_9BACT|nr:DUF3871 family protein [Flaviaesturariibacter aridisoli]TCZ73286.1 DUF3871 family protein [Flaviaesturariibacter aridisoli]